ncbi:hypothetical protein BV898_00192 [Hypsibius exemplaris]|uniref:G-protein coupled receptors family 1 profile domain-containing protein n=1 Tax=Hypsibius exemplaris TaxID=2072580 RepID=A0A1W0XF15_HYPEX|nr:hypothetical protein BV898_00192 [Hypsibius exemplaris]
MNSTSSTKNLTIIHTTNISRPNVQAQDNSISWSIIPISTLLILVSGLLLTLPVLYLLLTARPLRTSFNIYVSNLVGCDLALFVLHYPLTLFIDLHGAQTWALGYTACTLKLYTRNVLEAVAINIHVCIAVNRVWAVVHPISYRNRHSAKVATFTCLTVWIYVHASLLPLLILDALYYRSPIGGCNINFPAQYGYFWFTNMVFFTVPWTRSSNASGEGDQQCIEMIRFVVTAGPLRRTKRRKKIGRRNSYWVLGLLTVLTTICWVPTYVMFIMVMTKKAFIPAAFRLAVIVLFNMQAALDPLLFVLALKPLRLAVFRLLRIGRQSRGPG